MQPESPHVPKELDQGLPAVQPPSGRHIVQMFVVPAIIVASIVAVIWGISELRNWFFGVARTPEEYLANLDSTNPDVRWRAAMDLAQVLRGDDQLASNAWFALELADRLQTAFDESQRDEDSLAERFSSLTDKERAKEQASLDNKSKYVLFLGSCMGNSVVPVGVPLLNEMALNQRGSDAKAVARRRWQAIWALANLGENRKRFDKLPPERQETVLAELEREAAAGKPDRRERAQVALSCLKGQCDGKAPNVGVDKTLAACAADDNPFIRKMTAFALTFWEGGEDALVRLSYDDGHGDQSIEPFFAEHEPGMPEARGFSRKPGLATRINAAVALARRGSDRARLDLLAEALDEDSLRDNFYVKRKDGQEAPDEVLVRGTLDNALKAVVKLHEKRPDLELKEIDDALEKLTHSPNVAVRTEVERARIALGKK